MLHTNCHALHFTLPSDAKIQKNAVPGNSKKETMKQGSKPVYQRLSIPFVWRPGSHLGLQPWAARETGFILNQRKFTAASKLRRRLCWHNYYILAG